MTDELLARWFPVAASSDLVQRHSFHGQLLDNELVVWRADNGDVNVWDNRCLHRGVRLSIGLNDGHELMCQYHGWRYANRTGGCTYIPAHPADSPARTICTKTFRAIEKYGLVWSGIDPAGEVPEIAALADIECFELRHLAVNAPATVVIGQLNQYQFSPDGSDETSGVTCEVQTINPFTVSVRASSEMRSTDVVVFVQPVDDNRSIVRPVMAGLPAASDRLGVQRHHNTVLSALRDRTERDWAERERTEPGLVEQNWEAQEQLGSLSVPKRPVSIEVAQDQAAAQALITGPMPVRVERKWRTAEGIMAFEFVAVAGQLPTCQPGAHIDVHISDGLVRQYSLTNGPGDLAAYRIGVKLEPDSTGGSKALHELVDEGDLVHISVPRNNFALRRDSLRTVLIAGGIGVTPLLSMAQALDNNALKYEMHYFCQSDDHVAFSEVLDELTDVTVHLGLGASETGEALRGILGDGPGQAECVYVCGPGPMLDAVRGIASESGWADDTVHFEYFKNSNEVDDSSSFEVDLARSALSLRVNAGQSILDVLEANGVAVQSSCSQGACGTCSVAVLSGEPHHQDVYLSETEKQAGNQMMVCVSRSHGQRLTLDI